MQFFYLNAGSMFLICLEMCLTCSSKTSGFGPFWNRPKDWKPVFYFGRLSFPWISIWMHFLGRCCGWRSSLPRCMVLAVFHVTPTIRFQFPFSVYSSGLLSLFHFLFCLPKVTPGSPVNPVWKCAEWNASILTQRYQKPRRGWRRWRWLV